VTANQANSIWQYITESHLKMALGPKHVEAITTEEEKEDCGLDGIIVKLIAEFFILRS
jgi:hypothetical protein